MNSRVPISHWASGCGAERLSHPREGPGGELVVGVQVPDDVALAPSRGRGSRRRTCPWSSVFTTTRVGKPSATSTVRSVEPPSTRTWSIATPSGGLAPDRPQGVLEVAVGVQRRGDDPERGRVARWSLDGSRDPLLGGRHRTGARFTLEGEPGDALLVATVRGTSTSPGTPRLRRSARGRSPPSWNSPPAQIAVGVTWISQTPPNGFAPQNCGRKLQLRLTPPLV